MSVERKLTNKTLVQKCEIIREVENGMTNKDASEKFGVPKNTISAWIKNKDKLLAALGETSSQTKKLRSCEYEEIDKAVYQWFILQRSQQIPIDGAMIKEKALSYAKEFQFRDFKASDGWMEKWKKRFVITTPHYFYVLKSLFITIYDENL